MKISSSHRAGMAHIFSPPQKHGARRRLALPSPRPGMCILLGVAASSASVAVRITPLLLDALRL
jgi:hypothetical protein